MEITQIGMLEPKWLRNPAVERFFFLNSYLKILAGTYVI